MPRRVSLPGASELFRNTNPVPVGVPDAEGEPRALSVVDPDRTTPVHLTPEQPAREQSGPEQSGPERSGPEQVAAENPARDQATPPRRRSASARSSGRIRHEEKITIYVSSEELIALEEARLRLRAEHGVAVDRGRIVREAISAAMADFVAHGPQSRLVHTLAPASAPPDPSA